MMKTFTIKRVTKNDFPETDLIDDKVFLVNNHYENFFGKAFKEFGSLPWKRGILKIKHGSNIVRLMFHSGNSIKINESIMGLPLMAMQVLNVQDGVDYDFELSKGNRFLFMWKHPDHLTRIGFKYTVFLGSLSIFIGIISCFF